MRGLIPKILSLYRKVDDYRFDRVTVYSWVKIISSHISIYFLGASLMVIGFDVMQGSEKAYLKEIESTGNEDDAYFYNRMFVYSGLVVMLSGAVLYLVNFLCAAYTFLISWKSESFSSRFIIGTLNFILMNLYFMLVASITLCVSFVYVTLR